MGDRFKCKVSGWCSNKAYRPDGKLWAQAWSTDGVCATPGPTPSPSPGPSQAPSISTAPSDVPSLKPSQAPSVSAAPSDVPSLTPSQSPSLKPSQSPSDVPSLTPSQSPSPCIIPTTVTGSGLTYIGDGFCQDTNNNFFDYVQVPEVITTVEDCYAKCSSIGAWASF